MKGEREVGSSRRAEGRHVRTGLGVQAWTPKA